MMASVWGNDLTLHGSSVGLRRATRRALTAIDALHTDCQRDQQLAVALGFDSRKPMLVAPGSGGVPLEHFQPHGDSLRQRLNIPTNAPVVLNARGIREYVDLPAFFAAVSLLLAQRPDVHVVCAAMAGSRLVEKLVSTDPNLGRIHLLTPLSYDDMPALYRSAEVVVSLTKHDGTPNSLLEAMASGCFPVVSPVESVLEWVDDGVNGLVASVDDPVAIAHTMGLALDQHELRAAAATFNRQRIADRAELQASMERAFQFYERLANQRSSRL